MLATGGDKATRCCPGEAVTLEVSRMQHSGSPFFQTLEKLKISALG